MEIVAGAQVLTMGRCDAGSLEGGSHLCSFGGEGVELASRGRPGFQS
jgi:hypothetical protein